jgi:hypothetical protein
MSRRYNKLGLRRDLNFTDIPDKKNALNNLLIGLVDVDGESFISEDLEPIRGISTISISNDDFLSITGLALKLSNEDGDLEVYKPVVKIKNRLNISEFTIGSPSLFGGNGLTNRYYAGNQINSTNPIETIFTGTATHTETFWENGNISFGTKFKTEYDDIYGGVQWDGFFKPVSNGVHTFTIQTKGFFTFEFDNGSGGYSLIKRKSQYEYTFEVQPAAAGSTTLTLTLPESAKNLLINDVIINNSITQFQDPDIAPVKVGITIVGIDTTTGIITLSAPLAAELEVATNFTFRFRIGLDDLFMQHSTNILEAYATYKIRMRFWIPNIPQINQNSQRTFTIRVNDLNNPAAPVINFKYLYSEDYVFDDTPETYGDFRKFYVNKLDLFGGTIGGQTYNDYQSIISKSPIGTTYEPKIILNDIIKQTKTVATSTTSDVLGMAITDKIEAGNFVIGTNIAAGTRVKGIASNAAVILTQNAVANGTDTVAFIDHKGLIDFDNTTSYTSGGFTLTNVDPAIIAELKLGDVVINANTITTQHTVVTRIDGTTLTVSNAFNGNGTNVRSYFYRSKGLYNNSLDAYDNGVVAAPTVLTSTLGSNTLTVAYTDNIVNGMVVQFSNRIASGTTVTDVNQTTKVITLSQNIQQGDINPFSLIVFAPAGTTDNKEICFTPLDISPPFTATEKGMQTTVERPSMEIVPVSGTGNLKFLRLSADNVPELTASPTATYNRTIQIRDITGASYRILGNT